MFKIKYLINTTANFISILNMIYSKSMNQFFQGNFLFSHKENSDFTNFSPFFGEDYKIIGYAYIIKQGFNDFSNCYYNPYLIKIIHLIIFFKLPNYNLADIDHEKFYYLNNEKWMKNFKNKYMYRDTKTKLENHKNKNITLIINNEQKNKKLLNKLIYILIMESEELNKKYNEIINLPNDVYCSEPDCESMKDLIGEIKIFFYNNYYVLDEDIHNKLFNLNEQQSKEIKKRIIIVNAFMLMDIFLLN